MMDVIVYKLNGKLELVFPSMSCGLTVEQIAEKDVPADAEKIITKLDNLPGQISDLSNWDIVNNQVVCLSSNVS